jgi:hypothetical protein
MLLFRDAKTREVVVGAENRVEQCTYVAAITRAEEELNNELTGGWKVIEESLLAIIFYIYLLTRVLFRWRGGRLGHIYKYNITAIQSDSPLTPFVIVLFMILEVNSPPHPQCISATIATRLCEALTTSVTLCLKSRCYTVEQGFANTVGCSE